jgi:anti-sigma B factor antagonist
MICAECVYTARYSTPTHRWRKQGRNKAIKPLDAVISSGSGGGVLLLGRSAQTRATVERIDRGTVVILKPVGRMTIDSTKGEELLKQDVIRALEEGRRQFVIDGTDVTYADSAALGEMVRAYVRVIGQGGQLLFAVPAEHVLRNRFHLTKLDHELSIYPTVDEAIAALPAT